MIRVMIVDDHAIVRKGIRALLTESGDFEIVAEAANGQEAVQRAVETQPDVILMDLLMPGMDGIEATRQITGRQPETRILVLTSFAADNKLFPAIKAGALGYLLKDSSPEELVRAIRMVHRGEPALHPTIARKLLQEVAHSADLEPAPEVLTARELAVLRLIAQGMSNQEIADELSVSEATVRAACQPHPRQAAPGLPHAGRPLRRARRVDRRRRRKRGRRLGHACAAPRNALQQSAYIKVLEEPPCEAALLLYKADRLR